MSFSFNFQLEEDELDKDVITPSSAKRSEPTQMVEAGSPISRACHHVSLDDLLDSLPETISYRPFSHPSLKTPLLRRELFDARFQLISQENQASSEKGKEKANPGEEYVVAKSDLIPGLYEGGLKTWEGGVDLVEVLSEGAAKVPSLLRSKRILEVGCGTAFPSSYILDTLLSSPSTTEGQCGATTIHLQDYNLLVLQLVTLPNLILAALPYLPHLSLRSSEEAGDVESVVPDLKSPGHLGLTTEVKTAFKSLLKDNLIALTFTYGHWGGLAEELRKEEGYDLVLTAETIYAEESVDDLIAVLHSATTAPQRDTRKSEQSAVELEDTFGDMSVKDNWVRDLGQGERVILVAAKVLYFGVGVGDGLTAFVDRVKSDSSSGTHDNHKEGWSKDVKKWEGGVVREVVQVGWGTNVSANSPRPTHQ